MEKIRNYVAIKIEPGHANIEWSYQTYFKHGEGERVSCFIPAFDIYYQAKNKEDMLRKGKIITEMFFDYYIVDEGKNGLKKLALKLHSLGFKAPNDLIVLKSYSHNKPIATKFSSNKVSSNGFTGAEMAENKSAKTLAVA